MSKIVKKPLKKKVVVKEAPRKAMAEHTKKIVPPVKDESEKKKQAPKERGVKSYALLRGMHDVLPKDEVYLKALYHQAEDLAEHFQFGKIETPVLEEANLFIRSIGKGTDVVDKEMYTFEDADGDRVCLRPEGTAAVVRSYLQHGIWNQSPPFKAWYWGPMFRHDRPQAGRYRQFTQVGFETIGTNDPVADAELVLVAYNFLRDFGLSVEIHINSIGTTAERERYQEELVSYYRSKRSYLCEDCRKRLLKNPLRLLDCKEEQCQPIKEEAPQISEWLTEPSKNHFMKVLEYLDKLGVPYVLTPTLVRGLDYYTHTVFEIYTNEGETTAQSALGGGGRYDGLVEQLGGKPTGAAGLSLGIERVVAALKRQQESGGLRLKVATVPDAFFAQLGDQARADALKILNDLRGSGLLIASNFFKNSLKAQLDAANGLKVPYVLILGQKEVQEGSIIIRDMESGEQEVVDQKKVDIMLKKKLKKA